MTPDERREADAWYRALREWRVRELVDTLPRGPRRSGGGPPPRVVWGCPVCRSTRVAEIDLELIEARARGEDLAPLVARIADGLRTREALVWRHAQNHLDPDPPQPVIGEWARSRSVRVGRHLATPVGWVPVGKVLAAIREAPEETRVLLDTARFGRGPKSLLDRRGHWKSPRHRDYGRAALWLRDHL